jgi:hypothetical protein
LVRNAQNVAGWAGEEGLPLLVTQTGGFTVSYSFVHFVVLLLVVDACAPASCDLCADK